MTAAHTQQTGKKEKDSREKQEHLCLLEGRSNNCGIYLTVSIGWVQLLFFQISESLLWMLRNRYEEEGVKGKEGEYERNNLGAARQTLQWTVSTTHTPTSCLSVFYRNTIYQMQTQMQTCNQDTHRLHKYTDIEKNTHIYRSPVALGLLPIWSCTGN